VGKLRKELRKNKWAQLQAGIFAFSGNPIKKPNDRF
jgi:hypothetical protein